MANLTIYNYANTQSYSLPDGQVQGPDGGNASIVSLNLVSQNAPDYTIPINENFLYLLENFTSASANGPGNAIQGQLWFDTTGATPTVPGVLKINANAGATPNWRPVSSLVAGNSGEVQYNNGSNVLAASANVKYNTGNSVLTVNALSVTNLANLQAELRVVGNANVVTNLNVTGNANIAGTGNVVGNLAVGSNLSVTSNIFVGNIFTSGSGNIRANTGYVIGNIVQGNLITTTSVPGTTTDAGQTGQIAVGATAIYVCIATNTWRKVDITTF